MPDAAAFDAYVGPVRELTLDYERGILALHDGVTPGGKRLGTVDGSVLTAFQEALDDKAPLEATATSLGNRLRVDTAAQGLDATQQSNGRANLALGTAATATVTTSRTDTTSGRLLKGGDFGLGIPGSDGGITVSDLDAVDTPSGFYRATSGTTTGTFPAGSAHGMLLVERYSAAQIRQTFSYTGGYAALFGRLYTRSYNINTSSWRPWVEFAGLSNANTWTAAQTFPGIVLKSTGGTTKTLTIDDAGNLLLDGLAVGGGSESTDWNI